MSTVISSVKFTMQGMHEQTAMISLPITWVRFGLPTIVFFFLVVGAIAVPLSIADAATLEVGPGKRFGQIEQANALAQPGDVVLVYPQPANHPYEKTAVFVRQKNLTFRAVPSHGRRWVPVSGQGFNYSGVGSTPRAIFQFNRGTDGCILEGFELLGAHNDSHNGAGVRINQANHVAIRNCSIHNNDMGIMSNGDGTPATAVDQRIEFCEIHHNGDQKQPGQNHNLYLGGTSVMLRFCEVHHSLTGHNVKSRAHDTRVEYCYVHDSANREFDLVDDRDTARPDSHAVLLGDIIVKDPKCSGNHAVIHFGQDGGRDHGGTLYLLFNTVITPFVSPVVELSAPNAKARLVGNLVSDGGQRQHGQQVASVRGGARTQNVTGNENWFSGDFGNKIGTGIEPKTNLFQRAAAPLFANAAGHDYHLTDEALRVAKSTMSADKIEVPAAPGVTTTENEPPLAWQYRHPAGKEKRSAARELMRGAYAP